MIHVIKADGHRVPFDPSKIEATCIRAGASTALAKTILQSISGKLYEGINTREIYKMVLSALADETAHPEIKHRYRLKESIMLMGPTGFNFESYIAQILEGHGYKIESIRTKLKGRCVEHEVDLIALSPTETRRIIVECKYHNFSGAYTGLKEALYTHARFLDLNEDKRQLDDEMLISNTKISQDALQFAKCVGQHVLSWRYPPERGLERLIEEKGLYPMTILQLNAYELKAFAKISLMVARDILKFEPRQISLKTGIGVARILKLQDQVRQILR